MCFFLAISARSRIECVFTPLQALDCHCTHAHKVHAHARTHAHAQPYDQQRLLYHGRRLEDERSLEHYGIGEDAVVWLFLSVPYPYFSEWMRSPQARLHEVVGRLVPCTRIALQRATSTVPQIRALSEARKGHGVVDLGPVGTVTFATVGFAVVDGCYHTVVAAAGGPIRTDQPLLLHFELDTDRDYMQNGPRLALVGRSDKVSHPWLRSSDSLAADTSSAGAASAEACNAQAGQVGVQFIPCTSGYSGDHWSISISHPALVYDIVARLLVEPESWDTDNSWLSPWAASAECFTSGDIARWKEDWSGALVEWASAWRSLGPLELVNDEAAWIASGLATRWMPRLHHRTPRRVQRTVLAVLLVAKRLRQRAEKECAAVVALHLPAMPTELWFLVLECAFPLCFTILDPPEEDTSPK